MSSFRFLLIASAALVAAGPAVPAAAQPTRAVPMDESDPRGQVASGLAALIVGGDFDGAAEYLRARAVPGSPAAADAAAQIAAVRADLSAGGYQVRNITQGQGNEIMILFFKRGAPPTVYILDVAPTAPFGINALTSGEGRFRMQTSG